MLEGNPFADLIPQTGARPARGTIYGPAPTPKVREPQDPLEIENQQLQNQKLRLDIAKKDPEADPEQAALKDTIKGLGLTELLTGVSRARGAVKGGWSTGITGRLLSNVPGTQAADFDAFLTQIEGGVILEKLQALKESSKTGASGMGALSEKEGARLAASVAALSPNMSAEALEQSLNDIERHAKTLQAVSEGQDPTNPEVAAKYGIPPATLEDAPRDNTVRGEGGNDPGLREMSPQQRAAYDAFWQANPNPTPEQLEAFQVAAGVVAPDERPVAGRAAEIIKAKREGRGVSYAIDRQAELRAEIDAAKKTGMGPLADSDTETLTVAGQTLGLSDEAAGIGRAASRALQGRNPIEGYQLGRDAQRLRIEDARRQMGYAGTAIEVVGGLASANPGSALASVGNLARQGAAGGALAGFGSGEGLEESVTNAAIGGAGGAAVGSALGAVAGRYAPRGMDPDIAAAAQAENVRISQPMIEGNRRAINRAGVLESDPQTAPVIQQGFANTADDIEAGAVRLGRGGTAQSPEDAGETVQRGARAFIQRSRGVADRLYNRARSLAGDTRFTPDNAIRQANDELNTLAANPETNAGEIAFLEGLRRDLAQPKSIDELRELRTSLRGRIAEQGLTSSQAEARALRIMDATQADAAANLPAGAASAFRRADMYYRERMVHIDDVLDKFIGGKSGVARLSGEQAFDKIKTLANKDGRRLAAVMRDLTQQERLDVAATIAGSIGRSADDRAFQLGKFLDQTDKLSPSARRTIFGPDGAESINRLRTLTMRLQDTQRQINMSKTARPLTTTIRNAARALVLGLMGGGMGSGSTLAMGTAAVAGGTMAATAARRALSARALMNPRVARWLAETADVSTPAQAQVAVRRLGSIASREAGLTSELTPLHQWLTETVSAPTPALAEEGVNNDNGGQ